MGALLDGQRRRLGTAAALALALVLALAGSTSPASRSAVAGDAVSALAGPPPASTAPMDQKAASVTVPGERRYPQSAATPGPAPAVRVTTTGNPVGKAIHTDIAGVLLKAYRAAVAGSPPGCHLPVSLLAAIGQVESGSLVGRPIDAQHRTSVVGPVLDGHRHASIPDTDGGRLDGDTTWDRAVGPMQFLPSTWRTFGVDGDGNGVVDPQDVEDASASTAAYLCYGGRNLTEQAGLRTAILSYNHSVAYLRLVLTYQQRFTPLDSAAVDLPTVLALTATPIPAPQLTPGNGAKPAANKPRPARHPHRTHATRAASADPTPTPAPATKKAKIHAASAAPHSAPTTPATTPSTTPAAPSSATTPATTPPTTPSAPGTPAEQTPTGTDSPPATPEPTPTPTPEDPQTPGTPGTPAPTDGPTCPTAPLPVDPSSPGAPTPTGIPSDPAQPADPTCAPCPEGVDPTPEAPCQPPTTPAVPVDPAATDPSTAAPSSAQ